MEETIGERVDRARASAGLTQRALAHKASISQATLSRIISGRPAKLPELVAIAWATGTTIDELMGSGGVADRVQCVARATNGADMGEMRAALLHFLELDAYLDDQAIPVPR